MEGPVKLPGPSGPLQKDRRETEDPEGALEAQDMTQRQETRLGALLGAEWRLLGLGWALWASRAACWETRPVRCWANE